MKIKMYTSDDCGACTMSKNMIGFRIIDSFEIVNLSDQPELKPDNVKMVPTFIQGDLVHEGFANLDMLEAKGFVISPE